MVLNISWLSTIICTFKAVQKTSISSIWSLDGRALETRSWPKSSLDKTKHETKSLWEWWAQRNIVYNTLDERRKKRINHESFLIPDLGFPYKDLGYQNFAIWHTWQQGRKLMVRDKNVFPEIRLFFTKINITIEEQQGKSIEVKQWFSPLISE